jgi:hypothetical protein
MKKTDSVSKHVVIGLGEVGSALVEVFKCDGEDSFKDIFAEEKSYELLHIAFPYSENFIEEVKRYQNKFNPKYTIIHSTVPIGTSRKCGAMHSPIRGVHPHLAESIKTFKKFLSGDDVWEVSKIFAEHGISCMCTNDQENTEALKLWDTTQYGILIMLNKEIHQFCKRNKLDFNVVYTLANETYNEGYLKMFRPEVVRPYLVYKDEPIGGHCVIPNAKLLDSYLAQQLILDNELLK